MVLLCLTFFLACQYNFRSFLGISTHNVSSDEEYFRNPSRSQGSDNWVIRFSQLKRLFRLITQYFTDVLHCPTASLEVPNLQAIAQDHNVVETLALCRLTIAIAVQGKKNTDIIAGIQKLPQADQRAIMTAIEKVRRDIRLNQSDLLNTGVLGHVKNRRARQQPHRRRNHDRVGGFSWLRPQR
jgi:hypothetical protein